MSYSYEKVSERRKRSEYGAKQLRLLPSEELYLARETFDVDGTLAKALRHLQEARRQGWSRVRACGSPCRGGSEREWSACLQYERQTHHMVTELKVLTLCAYRLSSLPDQGKKWIAPDASHGSGAPRRRLAVWTNCHLKVAFLDSYRTTNTMITITLNMLAQHGFRVSGIYGVGVVFWYIPLCPLLPYQ